MLNKGKPLFSLRRSSSIIERLAVWYHVLGPVDEELGTRIEREFPGTFETGEIRDVIETASSLNVRSSSIVSVLD